MAEIVAECEPDNSSDVTRHIGTKLAPYNPTNIDAVSIAIEMLKIKGGDIIYDLGCGDGRFLVEACRLDSSIRGVGIEYDHDVYVKACDNVSTNNMTNQIQVFHDNVLNINFDEATVLFIYLVPEGILKLKDQLLHALSRGVRIVTYVFSIPGLVPSRVEIYKKVTKLYLYQQE